MCGNNIGDGIAAGNILHILFQPVLIGQEGTHCRQFFLFGGAVVEVRRVPGAGRATVFLDFHKMDVFGDNALCTILNGVFNIEKQPGFQAVVIFVNKNGASLQNVHMAFADKINGGFQKRMAGADDGCKRQTGNGAVHFIKTHPLIAGKHRLAKADLHIPVAHGKRNMGDLIAPLFTRFDFAAKAAERFQEKGLDKMRLQLVRFHALHVFAGWPSPCERP